MAQQGLCSGLVSVRPNVCLFHRSTAAAVPGGLLLSAPPAADIGRRRSTATAALG